MQINKHLTIVIPCKNEEKYIGKTLESINNQIDIDDTVVLIADADSTDNTKNIISDFINKRAIFNVTVISGGSVSKGRNNGLKHVKTPYVLFMDADTVLLNPHTIKTYLSIMMIYDIELLSAPIKNTSDDIFATLMFNSFNVSNRLLSIFQPFSVGMFFMCKTSKVNEYGGFDETLIHSEDFILSKKFDKRKFRIGNISVGQDNRRFKRFGYFNMVKMLLISLMNQHKIEHFQRDNGYWK